MRLPHDLGGVERLRVPTREDPWRVLVSGCILGMPCGVDGTDYGMGGTMLEFFAHPLVSTRAFCPEDTALGTPRGMPDIHGGDGFAVLDGAARVLDENGNDLTAGMIAGGEAMLAFAQTEEVDFAAGTFY